MAGSSHARRQLLASTALVTLAGAAQARSVRGRMPWTPGEAYPPPPLSTGWQVLTPAQAALVTALADRLVPADENGPGAGQAGCAQYLDRQLAGPFGDSAWLYMRGPFAAGTPQQGAQSARVPREVYRVGLDAVEAHCQATFQRGFAALDPAQQDGLLTAMEAGHSGIVDDRGFFEMLLANVMESYFSDPAYGGNRDLAGWRLVAFPGVRYDYRDVIANPNQPYGGPPVGITGRPGWNTPE